MDYQCEVCKTTKNVVMLSGRLLCKKCADKLKERCKAKTVSTGRRCRTGVYDGSGLCQVHKDFPVDEWVICGRCGNYKEASNACGICKLRDKFDWWPASPRW